MQSILAITTGRIAIVIVVCLLALSGMVRLVKGVLQRGPRGAD